MNIDSIPGLTHIASELSPEDVSERLVAELERRTIQLFARIDHAGNAAQVGLALRPTELLIFGNARAGTPLMQLQQTTAIDLPLKVLVWQDEHGQTWLSYNQPTWIAARHGVESSDQTLTHTLTSALETVTAAAVR
jgi:uncharacterized protein (DUF302 family)